MREKLKTLGVTLDQTLSFQNHINSVICSCNCNILALCHIRRSLTHDVANTIGCSIVNTRLDYCQSLLYRVAKIHLKKLQYIQNKLARVICDVGNRDHYIIDQFRNLHWLPVRSRIEFKVATLCFKSLFVEQPRHLRDISHPYISSRTLRSTDKQLLVLPRTKMNTATARFSYSGPEVWNLLPSSLRSVDSNDTFKSQWKVNFFC